MPDRDTYVRIEMSKAALDALLKALADVEATYGPLGSGITALHEASQWSRKPCAS